MMLYSLKFTLQKVSNAGPVHSLSSLNFSTQGTVSQKSWNFFWSVMGPTVPFYSFTMSRSYKAIKLRNPLGFSYIRNMFKDQLFKTSRMQFDRWLFGTKKFMGFSRKRPHVYKYGYQCQTSFSGIASSLAKTDVMSHWVNLEITFKKQHTLQNPNSILWVIKVPMAYINLQMLQAGVASQNSIWYRGNNDVYNFANATLNSHHLRTFLMQGY